MALTTSYLTSVKNLDSIINSVVNAKEALIKCVCGASRIFFATTSL